MLQNDVIDSTAFSVSDAWAGLRLSLRESWRAARIDTAALIITPLIVSLMPAALALALRGLVNSIIEESDGLDAGRFDWQFYVIASLVIALIIASAASINAYFIERHAETLEHRIAISVLEHAQTLEFSYFEDPRFQDTIRQARQAPGKHAHDVMAKCIRSGAALLTIGSLLVVLARIELRLILYLVPLSIPFLIQRWWIGRLRFEIQFAQNRSRRWVEYFSGQLMAPTAVPEARVLGIAPLFIRRAETRLGDIRKQNRSVYLKQGLSSGLFNNLAVVAVYIALFQATRRTIDGDLTVGDIAVFAAAATAVRTAIEALLSSLSSLRWHLAHLTHLRRFLAMPPTRTDLPPRRKPSQTVMARNGPRPAQTGPLVRVEGVSFHYPAAEEPVLNGFDLEIEAGETVGLVGRNGSGKTTLVKLLAGLYVPHAGSITVNGLRTDEADLAELRDQMAIVFQNFGQYNATVAENIALGNWSELLEDRDRIREIAEWAGLDRMIESMPHGYDTLLGRDFGDVSLSGGQWQRLAIARAFAHDAPLMVLDEPTANLDAEAEYGVFKRFAELASDRAALLISHRFSTLALADRIVVVDEGRVIESGSHDQLLALDGSYARLHRLFRSSGETGMWTPIE